MSREAKVSESCAQSQLELELELEHPESNEASERKCVWGAGNNRAGNGKGMGMR